MASTGIISGDTNRLQTSEVRYAVEYADANGDLGRLRVDVMRLETVAGERLEPMHRILGKRSRVVATCLSSILDDLHGQLHQLRCYATLHRAYPLANERHPRVAESKE
ncbi:MAG: hypothetical protein E5299_01797 [Burkholderia gladioli]|nr:MAG: hypothetical protein E5299_01797 [Burkholderia gladioli]